MAPVLCGSITTKQKLLGLGWSITSLMSMIAFITAAIMASIIFFNANKMSKMYNFNRYNNNYNRNYNYNNQYNYNNYYYQNYNNNQQNQGGGGANDRESQMYQLFASVGSHAVIFVGFYTALLSLGLTIFGRKCVVGYMSLNGNYIPPSLTGTGSSKKIDRKYFGIFMGMLFFISNLFLVAAVILDDFRMGSGDGRQREGIGSFAIEKTATFLGTIFKSLAVVYLLYSLVLYSYKDDILREEKQERRRTHAYKSPRVVLA